jgi:hypothetical protein
MVITVEASGGVIVAPSVLGAQLLTPAGHPVVFLKSVSVVGGSGFGWGGVEYVTGWDSWVIPPVMFAPASAAVTVPESQLPTPERGV